MDIGKRISTLRGQYGFTQNELAVICSKLSPKQKKLLTEFLESI